MQTSIRLNERQAKEIQKRAEQINVSAHAMMLMLMELGMKLMDSGITLNLSDDPVSDTTQCTSKENIQSEH